MYAASAARLCMEIVDVSATRTPTVHSSRTNTRTETASHTRKTSRCQPLSRMPRNVYISLMSKQDQAIEMTLLLL